MNAPKWFVAVLVIGSQVADGGDIEPLLDLQFRLIRAHDAETAFRRALALGEVVS